MMAGEQLHACVGHGIQVGLFPGGHCNSRKNSWHFCFIVSTKFLWFAKRQVLREKEFAINDLQTVSRSFSRYRNPQQDLWKGQLWFRGCFTLGNNLVLTLHTSNLFSDDWLHVFNWKDKNAIKKTIWWKDYWLNISYAVFIAINRNTFLRKYFAYAACKVRGGHSTYLNISERILLEIKIL